MGPYCGAFCYDLPTQGASVKAGSDGGSCAFVDLIDDSNRWFSVEWCKRKDQPLDSAADFYAKWDDHAIGYLSSDFGNAQYSLVYRSHILLPDGRPAVVFVGSGKHNGGKSGSVMVVAAQREGYSAVSYLLLDRVLAKDSRISESSDFAAIVSFANSVRAAPQ